MAKEIPAEARVAVNEYIRDGFAQVPDMVTFHEKRVRAIPIPPHHISPEFGKLLSILVQASSAKNILEVGTMWGYSTWWMHQGLSEHGKITTIEKDLKHWNAAQEFFADIQPHRITSLHTDALTQLDTYQPDSFDFVFLDADKREYPNLFHKLLPLLQTGGMLVVDNVLFSSAWKGETVASQTDDGRIQGAQQFNRLVADCAELRSVPVALNSGIMVAVKS